MTALLQVATALNYMRHRVVAAIEREWYAGEWVSFRTISILPKGETDLHKHRCEFLVLPINGMTQHCRQIKMAIILVHHG